MKKYKQKRNYFLIITNTDYRKVVTKVNEIVTYIYPDREIQSQRETYHVPILHNNVSSYTHTINQKDDQ